MDTLRHMRSSESVSNSRRAACGVALLAVLSIFVLPAGAIEARAGRPLAITVGSGRTVVAASGCNWPEGEQFGPGSSVEVTVTSWFAGAGRIGAPTTIGRSRIVPSSAGGWEYTVPRAPLAELPVWATEVVVAAEAQCHQVLGGGFDYDPASVRRAIVRPAAPSTTTTTTTASDPLATTSPAPAAEPVAGTPTFTG